MIVLSPTSAASQKVVMMGSARLVVVARARAPHDAAVQHCLEYRGSWHPGFELEGSLGRSYGSRVYFRKLHHALYVCMVITYSRVWINQVRLPILLVVS